MFMARMHEDSFGNLKMLSPIPVRYTHTFDSHSQYISVSPASYSVMCPNCHFAQNRTHLFSCRQTEWKKKQRKKIIITMKMKDSCVLRRCSCEINYPPVKCSIAAMIYNQLQACETSTHTHHSSEPLKLTWIVCGRRSSGWPAMATTPG